MTREEQLPSECHKPLAGEFWWTSSAIMSAAGSPIKSGKSRSIPTRRILINDPSQLPHDYSSTPGGTIFSTTPEGRKDLKIYANRS